MNSEAQNEVFNILPFFSSDEIGNPIRKIHRLNLCPQRRLMTFWLCYTVMGKVTVFTFDLWTGEVTELTFDLGSQGFVDIRPMRDFVFVQKYDAIQCIDLSP